MSDHEHYADDQKVDHHADYGDDRNSLVKHDGHHELDLKPEEVTESPLKEKHGAADGVDDEADIIKETQELIDEKMAASLELIKTTAPSTALEQAYADVLDRKDQHILRLTNEIQKLKAFISKRKQTYKRKRKDEGAPTRALSAYNIFVQDRFALLAKENEKALKSTDTEAQVSF